jgi:2-polyprenyl-3-methyl-5-hydroxy-6-metoxy-1,4-benzoquinol methylase
LFKILLHLRIFFLALNWFNKNLRLKEEDVMSKDSGELGYIERIVPDAHGMENLLQASLAKYRFAGEYCADSVVLDVGCGSGHGSVQLRKSGARRVVGVDVSRNAIEYAHRHFGKKRVDFLVMDCMRQAFQDNSFDVVVSFEVIEHLKAVGLYLREVTRVLKRDGIFVLSTPNRILTASGEPNPYHIREFSLSELEGILGKYFSKVNIYGLKFVHPKAVRYEEASRVLEKISVWSRQLSFFSRLLPKIIKDFVFNLINPGYPLLVPEDIEVVSESVENSRVFIGVCFLQKL